MGDDGNHDERDPKELPKRAFQEAPYRPSWQVDHQGLLQDLPPRERSHQKGQGPQEAQVRSHQAYGTLLRQARGYQGRRCRGGARERYLKSCSERFQTSLALSCALSDLQVPTCGMVLRLALGYSNK